MSTKFLEPKGDRQNPDSIRPNTNNAGGMQFSEILEKTKVLQRYTSKDIEIQSLHCAVLQKGGSLVIENCQLSMMFSLDERLNFLYSTVTALEGSTLKMNRCEVKSQRLVGITGITSIFGDVSLTECRICDNFSCGIYLLCNSRNIAYVYQCSINKNKIAGVLLEGYCPKVLIKKYVFNITKIKEILLNGMKKALEFFVI